MDDDHDALAEARSALEAAGYAVVTACHGRDALLRLTSSEHVPCAIVLDINMPVMSGWELLAIVRSYVRFRDIPVVVSSSMPIERYARPAFEAVLPKPFSHEALAEAVRGICGTKKARAC